MKKRLYFDHNATSPLRPEVCEYIKEFILGSCCGNPSSIHTSGRSIRRKIDNAREYVAKLIGAKPSEIVFTSGGVESNHLAWNAFQKKGKKIATTVTEHSCIKGASQKGRNYDVEILELKIEPNGSISDQEIQKMVDFQPDLLSVHHANNETGILYDVSKWVSLVKPHTFVHTDAVQSVGKIPVHVTALGIDYLTMSGHKLGALQGIGALYIKKGSPFEPLWLGGSQERGKRTGTENVIGILSLGKACEIIHSQIHETEKKYQTLRDRFEKGMTQALDGVSITGSTMQRIGNTTHMIFEGLDAESLLIAADLEGIDVSTGSACHSGATEPSHVITAMGIHPTAAKGAVRFSLGWNTTTEDIDRALQILPSLITKIRQKQSKSTPC